MDGSQQKAFEELVCQLASAEKVPEGSKFIRKAAPDAGVECYWKLPDSSEWAWQAKFFLSSPTSGQWQQIDESVQTALDKHQNLSNYIVCLPIDRSDPRKENEKSFMSEWDKRATKWEKWASDRGMAVTFDYWGEHEVFERLSKEDHRGRHYFWFNSELFSNDWFRKRVEEAVANVGPRYTPELDVQLPVACLFDGIGRTSAFRIRIRKIQKSLRDLVRYRLDEPSIPQLKNIHLKVDEIFTLLDAVEETPTQQINWNNVVSLTRECSDIAYDCGDKLRALSEAKKAANDSEKTHNESERLKAFASDYVRLARKLPELTWFAESSEAHLANLPALLLTADAGKGKTHLFCDIAIRRTESNSPTVLLIGGNLNLEEPWTQIVRSLGLSCGREEFLGALEAAAQARGSRAVILVDALNEGEGKVLWPKALPAFLLSISRSPWLGVALSVRTSYEDAIIQEGLVPTRLVKEVHQGFADHEYEATKTFFEHFGIQQPSIPLLLPEFQNPLFLKMFCQGLHNNHMTTVPAGLQGITAVFKFFVDSVNKKLSGTEYLDFNPKLPIVWRALEAVAERLAEQRLMWLPLEEVAALVDSVLPKDGYENSLLRHLVSEGVLAENRFYDHETHKYAEGVHFAYERFTDHLVAKHLLDRYLNTENPADAFEKNGMLFEYVKDPYTCSMHQGLIEAFSVQLPERVSKELFELIPFAKDYDSVIEAFIDSLIWRDPSTINVEVVRTYINDYVSVQEHHHNALLNCILMVAANPKNPLNADFLHRNLKNQDMALRDSWWSIFLHEQYGRHGAVDRLIDWAWAEDSKVHIEDESIRLSGLALCWFLTSSNRFLRDRATKALVRLFENRTEILRVIMGALIDANDPYVVERLMAVVYGCVMRSNDSRVVRALALDVYSRAFEESAPPVNILTRDYARGVIERAIALGLVPEVDVAKVRPPYCSEFPREIPSEEDLKRKYDTFDIAKTDIDYAASAIWQSVMSWGDFARYIIGTNHGSFPWTSLLINEPVPPTRRERHDAFVGSLTKGQAGAFEKYRRVRQNVNFYKRQPMPERIKDLKFEATDELLNELMRVEDQEFRKKLGKKKSSVLTADLVEYIDLPHDDDFRFDLRIAQRWILQRVFELGWSVERFGRFDRYVNYHDGGREAHKVERIGKKYQWIAYYEFLARVADNFRIRKDRWSGQNSDQYEGPWQDTYLRNIDPSCLITKTYYGSGWNRFTPTWWFPTELSWKPELTQHEWVRDSGEIPSALDFILVTEPSTGTRWLNLESYVYWNNSPQEEDQVPRYPYRNVRCWLQAYLVRQTEFDDLIAWMKGNWKLTDAHVLPESHGTDEIFLGEFFWAPAFVFHNIPYYYRNGWVGGEQHEVIPKAILLTSDQYSHSDSGYDCSVDESIIIRLLCKTISDEMRLTWKGREGYYHNDEGDLVAFDPSVSSLGPSALLVNQAIFSKFLEEKSYTLIWVLTGERYIVTGDVPGSNWPGRMNLLGVYSLEDGKVVGNTVTEIEE